MGGPIPWTSITAYPVAPDDADLFLRCIRDADAAYLDFILKRPEDKAPPQMMPGGAFR